MFLAVLPAKAGIQILAAPHENPWAPACAGVTTSEGAYATLPVIRTPVVPAKTGIHSLAAPHDCPWTPAYAGVTTSDTSYPAQSVIPAKAGIHILATGSP